MSYMNKQLNKESLMEYWYFSDQEKEMYVHRLSEVLSVLRASVKASQEEVANVIGLSRQTYSAIECGKRKMTWNTYMSLILFFDYNPASHDTIRKLGVFPHKLDECWLAAKSIHFEGD